MQLEDCKDVFSEMAPAGFYIALRMNFFRPEEELNAFPPDWVELYTIHGLAVSDPNVRWMYSNTGSIRWDALEVLDTSGFHDRARDFHLNFGATISVVPKSGTQRRSFAVLSRSERNLTDGELGLAERLLLQLANVDNAESLLTEAEREALAFQAQGLQLKQMAYELGISESAVKARLFNGRRKLGARTNAQAALIATRKNLI